MRTVLACDNLPREQRWHTLPVDRLTPPEGHYMRIIIASIVTFNDVMLDLKPGAYGLICFYPDAKDGKPHLAHGMVATITVE